MFCSRCSEYVGALLSTCPACGREEEKRLPSAAQQPSVRPAVSRWQIDGVEIKSQHSLAGLVLDEKEEELDEEARKARLG